MFKGLHGHRHTELEDTATSLNEDGYIMFEECPCRTVHKAVLLLCAPNAIRLMYIVCGVEKITSPTILQSSRFSLYKNVYFRGFVIGFAILRLCYLCSKRLVHIVGWYSLPLFSFVRVHSVQALLHASYKILSRLLTEINRSLWGGGAHIFHE